MVQVLEKPEVRSAVAADDACVLCVLQQLCARSGHLVLCCSGHAVWLSYIGCGHEFVDVVHIAEE